MTGWRVGYTVASPMVTATMYKLYVHTITGMSPFIQEAALEVFMCDEEIELMRKEYQRRRDYVISELKHIAQIRIRKPEGTFYLWVEVESEMTSSELCEYLLEEARIVAVPGDAYGSSKCSAVRISIGNKMCVLEKAVKQLKKLYV